VVKIRLKMKGKKTKRARMIWLRRMFVTRRQLKTRIQRMSCDLVTRRRKSHQSQLRQQDRPVNNKAKAREATRNKHKMHREQPLFPQK
jgi:hypothetical protein